MRKSYYSLNARLTPNWSLPDPGSVTLKAGKRGGILRGELGSEKARIARWKDPPHVALANLGWPAPGHAPREEQMRWFVERYGPLDEDLPWIPGQEFWLTLDEFRHHQEGLRRAWRGRDLKLLPIVPTIVGWKTRRGRFVLEALPLSYLCLLLARDIAEGRAKICRAPDCSAPYFVAHWRAAKFCSHRCAVRIAQRNLRKKQRRKKR